MSTKLFMAGAVLTALMTGTAHSQTPSPRPETSSAITGLSHKGGWRTSKVIGLNVYNDKNEKIGEVEEVIADQNGKLQSAILGVGGFLEIGERKVEVSFDKLKFSNETVPMATSSAIPGMTTGSSTGAQQTRSATEQWYPDHAVLNLTKDQLKSLPEFKYN